MDDAMPLTSYPRHSFYCASSSHMQFHSLVNKSWMLVRSFQWRQWFFNDVIARYLRHTYSLEATLSTRCIIKTYFSMKSYELQKGLFNRWNMKLLRSFFSLIIILLDLFININIHMCMGVYHHSFEQLRIEECFFFSEFAILVLYNVQWGKRCVIHCHWWGSFEEWRIEKVSSSLTLLFLSYTKSS